MTTSGTHMRHSDAFSWYMERDPLLRSTVVAIALLDRSPDWERLRSRVDRATQWLPAFRARVTHPPFRLATPRWNEVAELDLDWHLTRLVLPAPAGWAELLDVARHKAVAAFDPARPLWEMTLVEGLPGGQAALVMVFHHSLTDGIGGVQLAMELFDAEPEPGPDQRPVPAEHPDDLSGLRLALESLGYDVAGIASLVRRLPRAGASAALRALRSPRASLLGAVRTSRSIGRFVAPVYDTKSPVMRGRRLSRRLDVLEVSLADLHRAGHSVDGHLNDAFLGAVTGGLRRYHELHGASVPELRVTLPISLRRPGDPAGGNLITLVRLSVPAGLPDASERMRALHAVVESWRAEPSLALTQPIALALNLLPNGVVGSMFKHVDFLASNVPGFPVPIYVGGAKVLGYYPFGPTIGASVNVTLLSYADTCCIGVNVDTAAVPDPEVFMECLREGFEEVLEVAGEHAPVRLPAHEPASLQEELSWTS